MPVEIYQVVGMVCTRDQLGVRAKCDNILETQPGFLRTRASFSSRARQTKPKQCARDLRYPFRSSPGQAIRFVSKCAVTICALISHSQMN